MYVCVCACACVCMYRYVRVYIKCLTFFFTQCHISFTPQKVNMQHVFKERHLFDFLINANPSQRHAVLGVIQNKQVNVIAEILLNILYGTLTLTDEDKKKLRKYKYLIRRLTDRRLSYSFKKKLLLAKSGVPIVEILKIITPLLNDEQKRSHTTSQVPSFNGKT